MRAVLLLTLIATACSSKREAPPETRPVAADDHEPTEASPQAVVARGSVNGRVTYDGKPPLPHRLDRSSDPACEPREILDESLLINAQGGLRNVLVRVVDVILKSPAPAAPVIVTQKDCVYSPRVQAAVEGQPIEFRNGDRTIHNIHGYDIGTQPPTALYNEAQPEGAAPIRKPTAGRDVVKVECDIHPWMRSYVIVSAHSFVAVTDEDGAFRIDDLPVGRYRLEAWHEVLGTRMASIEVRAADSPAVTISFAP